MRARTHLVLPVYPPRNHAMETLRARYIGVLVSVFDSKLADGVTDAALMARIDRLLGIEAK